MGQFVQFLKIVSSVELIFPRDNSNQFHIRLRSLKITTLIVLVVYPAGELRHFELVTGTWCLLPGDSLFGRVVLIQVFAKCGPRSLERHVSFD